jgi:hypothetical protein
MVCPSQAGEEVVTQDLSHLDDEIEGDLHAKVVFMRNMDY